MAEEENNINLEDEYTAKESISLGKITRIGSALTGLTETLLREHR